MASTNKTTNLTLNQWIGTDLLKREDFNADNVIIDTEIGNLKKIAHGAVADLAALKAIDTTNLTDNITIIVKSLGFYRFDNTSALTPDDNAIVQPTTGPGRWINDLASHRADNTKHITAQERTTWNAKQDALPVTNRRKITFGTADPTGGVDGDIYFQYV